MAYWDRPCAAAPWLSYRYKGRYGFIMIGATDDAHALREVGRSMRYDTPTADRLECWDGSQYVPVQP